MRRVLGSWRNSDRPIRARSLLPRDLWRVWRLRKARRTTGRSIAPGVQPREILDRDATRLLLPRLSAVPAGRRLTIAGALSAATAREWGPYAAVSMALPQDGTALIEAIDPDIVVIDSAAALPGETWSHLGNPAAIDRLLAAGAMVDAAAATWSSMDQGRHVCPPGIRALTHSPGPR